MIRATHSTHNKPSFVGNFLAYMTEKLPTNGFGGDYGRRSSLVWPMSWVSCVMIASTPSNLRSLRRKC